ncbi:MAG: Na+/H+ antiporter subunit E [Alphaproteobacteria bacterium]|jgi:multisubunit Na+/H+ antiporter MnhE subunit|nr:Na+/H+ antiporter subunit E [Alphaproteobacteria bacterium]
MWLLAVLICLWFVLSGYFTILPLIPGLIFIVLGFFLYQKARKDANFKEIFSAKPSKFFSYVFFMAKEVLLSNLYVAGVILKNNPSPQVFSIKNNFKTHYGTTIFANSTTITPSTITLKASENEFIIHALTYEAKDDCLKLAVYNKILQLEKSPQKYPQKEEN